MKKWKTKKQWRKGNWYLASEERLCRIQISKTWGWNELELNLFALRTEHDVLSGEARNTWLNNRKISWISLAIFLYFEKKYEFLLLSSHSYIFPDVANSDSPSCIPLRCTKGILEKCVLYFVYIITYLLLSIYKCKRITEIKRTKI